MLSFCASSLYSIGHYFKQCSTQTWITLLWLSISSLPSVAAPEQANQNVPDRPKVALVLSGGGALGYAHIGVLKVLEDMHVPVDCIVGTSMGALVGGTYAAGISPGKMQDVISRTDIGALFNDKPARAEIAQNLKRDDYSPLFDLTLGFNHGKIQLPSGASAGYKFELFLKELIGTEASVRDLDFDTLPTPYRAIATDLETGNMKAFDHGELSRVMRASMSLPGIVSPTVIDGTLYVDGGLSANLPVEAGRELCGDILIVVKLGTKPRKRDDINNSIEVALQSVILLVTQNTRRALESLAPGDILITPELSEFNASSFSQQEEIIQQGIDAALARSDQLARLAVTPEEYKQWQAQRQDRILHPLKISAVTVAPGNQSEAGMILRDVRPKSSEDFDFKELDQDIVNIYGRGDFSYVGYSLIPDGDDATVVITAENKPWGPGYLKFGLGAATDFTSPTQLNLAASYRRTRMNSLGAEWRTDLQVGYDSFLHTEFTQPLQVRDGAFISPYIGGRDYYIEFYNGNDHLGHAAIKSVRLGLDIGLTGRIGELKIGPYIRHVESEPNFGFLDLLIEKTKEDQQGVELSGIIDQLDRPVFPRSGLRTRVNVFSANQKDGDLEDYIRALADITVVKSFGRHSLSLNYEWGDEISGSGDLPEYDAFQLGGPNRLSGLYLDQLTGTQYRLASLRYYLKYANLPPQLGTGMYFGFSLESGEINDQLMKYPSAWINSGNVFWAADTILGDVYIGYGNSPKLEQDSWYLVIGPHF
jgi:NTE family protein